MPLQIYKEKKEEFQNDIKNSASNWDDIELKTRGQSSNNTWLQERQKRLTASWFGKISNLRPTTSCKNTVKAILYPSFTGNKATRFGLEHEEITIEQFESVTVTCEPMWTIRTPTIPVSRS